MTAQVFPIFEAILQVLEQQGQLKSLRSFAGTLLMAIDGSEYFGVVSHPTGVARPEVQASTIAFAHPQNLFR